MKEILYWYLECSLACFVFLLLQWKTEQWISSPFVTRNKFLRKDLLATTILSLTPGLNILILFVCSVITFTNSVEFIWTSITKKLSSVSSIILNSEFWNKPLFKE